MKRVIVACSLILALILSLCTCTALPGIGQSPGEADQTGFTVFFIDVGQADSALVVCDGKTMLIDGGNAEDSDLIYSFLRSHDISYLDYVVATHAHEDHVGGLAGALNYAKAQTNPAEQDVQETQETSYSGVYRYTVNPCVDR